MSRTRERRVPLAEAATLWLRREGWRHRGPELYRGRTVPILGETDIYDARRALKRYRHPQGWRPEPIWAARYARACVDIVSEHIVTLTRPVDTREWWATGPTARELVTWTLAGDALGRAFELVERMAEADTDYAELWREWAERRRREVETAYGIRT